MKDTKDRRANFLSALDGEFPSQPDLASSPWRRGSYPFAEAPRSLLPLRVVEIRSEPVVRRNVRRISPERLAAVFGVGNENDRRVNRLGGGGDERKAAGRKPGTDTHGRSSVDYLDEV